MIIRYLGEAGKHSVSSLALHQWVLGSIPGPGTYVHLVSSFSLCTLVFLLHLKPDLKPDQKGLKSDQWALLESSDTHWMKLPSLNMAYLFIYLDI